LIQFRVVNFNIVPTIENETRVITTCINTREIYLFISCKKGILIPSNMVQIFCMRRDVNKPNKYYITSLYSCKAWLWPVKNKICVLLINTALLNKYYSVTPYLLFYRYLMTRNVMTYIKEILWLDKCFGKLCCFHLQLPPRCRGALSVWNVVIHQHDRKLLQPRRL
jgi:hypothetical protein